MMTTLKVSTGNFDVLWNGEKTAFRIINGSLGLSGRNTGNMYGITQGEKITWVGSLQACKKLVARALEKKHAAGVK